MGEIVPFVSRKQVEERIEAIMRLAMRNIDPEYQMWDVISDAVLAAVRQPFIRLTAFTDEHMRTLFRTCTDLDERRRNGEPYVLAEAVIVSLARLHRETGTDLEKLWNVLSGTGRMGESPLFARDALGVVAMAWQISAHPENVVLSSEEYNKLRYGG